jgi:hypothetical protein
VQADGLVDASTAAFIRAVELQAALAADVPAECAGCGITPELQLGPCAVVADSTFQVIPVRIDLIAWVRRPPTHSEACRCRRLS